MNLGSRVDEIQEENNILVYPRSISHKKEILSWFDRSEP